MAIQKVLWDSKVKKIKTGLDAKALANAVKTTVFDKANEVARANQVEREKYTEEFKTAMKNKVKFLTGVLERSSNTTDDKELANLLKSAKLAVSEMADLHTEIAKRNKEYGEAFAGDGFRQDLYKALTDAKVMKPEQKAEVEKLLSAHVRVRSEIMGSDMGNNAEFTRVVELEKRGAVLLAEIETNCATGFKKLKNALTEKSDFKAEAQALIEDAWKNASEAHAKGIIDNLEKKLKSINVLLDNEALPFKARVDGLILLVPDVEKLRKSLSGVVKTLKLRLASLERTYGEHDWNADLLKRVRTAVKLPEERLEDLTPKTADAVKNGVERIKQLRQLMDNLQ
jgi:hypothetical protein